MSDDRRHNDPQPPDRDAGRALAVLARLPRSTAPESARENAHTVFLHGSVKRSSRRWVNLLMAATLGLLAVFWFGSQPTQEWIVLDLKSPHNVHISGSTELAIGSSLDSGLINVGAESEMTIQLGEKLRLTLLPETSLTLPKPPGRWFNRNRRMPITAGEIYGTSGSRRLGFDLVFSTDELEARLTGTTFAVFRTDSTSCVCLWEGGIAVTPLVGGHEIIDLDVLHRVWIYKDGRDPEIGTLDANETMKLQMTHDVGIVSKSDESEQNGP